MYRLSKKRRVVFFIDPIELSSYPVTETGYALLYRAWLRAVQDGDSVFVVYPNTRLSYQKTALMPEGTPVVLAHRIEKFDAEPYEHFLKQTSNYDAHAHVGSNRCHREAPASELYLDRVDVVVFRQEIDQGQREMLLRALLTVEHRVLVYLSPSLALDSRLSSKALPGRLAPRVVPKTFDTCSVYNPDTKAAAAISFIETELAQPETVIVKPRNGDNGLGITVLGRCPLTSERLTEDWLGEIEAAITRFGDIVVQEYVSSVRRPDDLRDTLLKDVPHERNDFGEIRFILIDGTIPRTRDGRRIAVARRVPTDNSLVADSGISYATRLSEAEEDFLAELGHEYLKLGIFFGGGDLIRTPDPHRPFLFTDAARSVCGHAVVTGALNGEPYLIVDQVLDSIERHTVRQRHRTMGTPGAETSGVKTHLLDPQSKTPSDAVF